jgi:hypothetical protein
LIEDSLSLVLRRLTDENGMHFETAANGFFNQPQALNRAQSVHGCALREGRPQGFDKRVLRAGDWAKSS